MKVWREKSFLCYAEGFQVEGGRFTAEYWVTESFGEGVEKTVLERRPLGLRYLYETIDLAEIAAITAGQLWVKEKADRAE